MRLSWLMLCVTIITIFVFWENGMNNEDFVPQDERNLVKNVTYTFFVSFKKKQTFFAFFQMFLSKK
jgi:hypothetical protein